MVHVGLVVTTELLDDRVQNRKQVVVVEDLAKSGVRNGRTLAEGIVVRRRLRILA